MPQRDMAQITFDKVSKELPSSIDLNHDHEYTLTESEYESLIKIDNAAVVEDISVGDFRTFDEDDSTLPETRAGRVRKTPSYLRDYAY